MSNTNCDDSREETPRRAGEVVSSIPLDIPRMAKKVAIAQTSEPTNIPSPLHQTEPYSIPSPQRGETKEIIDEVIQVEESEPTLAPIPNQISIPPSQLTEITSTSNPTTNEDEEDALLDYIQEMHVAKEIMRKRY